MLRTWTALALALTAFAAADAQLIIRPAGRPAGVIPPPSLPITGSLSTPGVSPARPALCPYLIGNPYPNLWGYAPYWPAWYDAPPPATVVNNFIPLPVPSPVVPPPAPVELRARLTLNVPAGSKVWLAGKEVDTAVSPLVLESPVLQSGQAYTFDVKVTWLEGRVTEERARVVMIEAGESKSLTYLAVR